MDVEKSKNLTSQTSEGNVASKAQAVGCIHACSKIKELKLKMKEIEVMGRITSKRIQHTDFPKLAKVTLEDEAGFITLNLWRNQVDQAKVGDFVSARMLNMNLNKFK